jgi:hypothetical protein
MEEQALARDNAERMAVHYREKAEEARKAAKSAVTGDIRQSYEAIAKSYNQLAVDVTSLDRLRRS